MKLHLSYPSKLAGVPSIGTTPRDSCPVQGGSCRTCYAALGMARMPHVARLLASNTAFFRGHTAHEIKIALLEAIPVDTPYFRFFWSGDCPDKVTAFAISRMAAYRANTLFWVSTRTACFDSLSCKPENLIVRKSVPDFGDHPDIGQTCVLLPGEPCPDDVWECPGQCGDCRVCYTHAEARIGYRWHGSAPARARLQSMIKKGEV